MSENSDQQKPGILYVDDEAKALRYFEKAFGRDYRVLTAESPTEGRKILDREASSIAIVVSDQRMPQTTGVEFLSIVRERHPGIVRILTTAYSDLDSAIQSVNQGRIYQYVVKPWDLQDFGMVLRRAADFHRILAERDYLMSLKLATLQRIILADRLKTLEIAAAAADAPLGARLRNALFALVGALPAALETNPAKVGETVLRLGLSQFVARERVCHNRILETFRSTVSDDTATLCGKLQHALADDCGGSLTNTPAEGGLLLTLSGGNGSRAELALFFGSLTETEPSGTSLLFLALLAAAVADGASLELRLSDDTLRFSPNPPGSEDALEEALANIFDRWDAESLGRA